MPLPGQPGAFLLPQASLPALPTPFFAQDAGGTGVEPDSRVSVRGW